MRRKIFILFLLHLLLQVHCLPAQNQTIVLRHAKIHRGDGSKMEEGIIAFKGGKIVYVGPSTDWNTAKDARWYDLQGQHVYPGLIAPSTTLGLREFEQVRASNDFKELGENNANIRSIIAYNTESDVIPTLRSNGILYAQITPQGGWISGRSSIVKLTGHNWEDAVVLDDHGLHVHWPTDQIRQGWWGAPLPDKPNKHYQEQRDKIIKYFQEANAWCKNAIGVNIKLQALCQLKQNNGLLFIHANRPFEIKDAVTSLAYLQLPMVIVGGKEAWRISDFLKKNNVSVIYIQPQSLPERLDDPVHRSYNIPRLLDSAGVRYCIGVKGFWQVRNLPFQAGQAVASGLPKEKAIQAITGSTAAILGMGDKTGMLQPGLSADLIVSKGDLLDMKSSTITRAYLQGEPVDLTDKQQALYHEYMKRYQLK